MLKSAAYSVVTVRLKFSGASNDDYCSNGNDFGDIGAWDAIFFNCSTAF